MADNDTAVWFDAVAKVAATIEGIKGGIAYAAATGGQGASVRPIPRSLSDTPAAILYYRGGTPFMTGAEKVKHRVQLRIYVPRTDLGDAYGLLMTYPRKVLTAIYPRMKAFGVLESLSVLEFGGVETEAWPSRPDSDTPATYYLVLPVELEAVEKYLAVTPVPA